MPITLIETNYIVQNICLILPEVSKEYDFRKYPADEYHILRDEFAAMAASGESIEKALVWKWGHWGKPNYPQCHRLLISEIQGFWEEFSESEEKGRPYDTFTWWQRRLGRPTTYITAAFLAHLVHHQSPLPIIDQHNYRAMNALIASVRPAYSHKKRPSSWNDIELLRSFMVLLCERLPNIGFGGLDRFLMMYGRNHVIH